MDKEFKNKLSMKKEPIRVLFVNSEIMPYMPETKMSKIGRYLPQGVQESGREIRTFIPKYGCINERRNQLHEVIRLSGMNIVINDIDRPLIIKVSSISSARMQVYFIDNEDYFHRKFIYTDTDDKFFDDNDERAIFFARGVLETVKKLRWKPDIVHCQGWISHLVPLLLKKLYNDDPIFENTKMILSLTNDYSNVSFDPEFTSKVMMSGIKAKDIESLKGSKGIDLIKLALDYSDGAIITDENLNEPIKTILTDSGIETLEYIDTTVEDTNYIAKYNEFYDKILGND